MSFLPASFTRKGATMIELMAVLAIMGLGIAAMSGTVVSGIYFANSTEKNIKAIGIAREGLEGVMNIRDTNWLRFSSDKVNCWKTDKYNGNCIGVSSPPPGVTIADGSYVLYSQNGVWYLSGATSINYATNWNNYSKTYQVGLDANNLPTQTGMTTSSVCNTTTQTSCLSPFTREITITSVGTDKILVESIVRWQQNLGSGSGLIKNVTIGTSLTNWKSKF